MTRVRAPGSSANLGPGFDVLGVALARYVWVSDEPAGTPCGEEHIVRLAYEQAGGRGDIWLHSELEPGRGLGYSAAARAAGAVLGGLVAGFDLHQARERAYPLVAALEGHGDNTAPSVFGGLHVITGHDHHRVPLGLPGRLLCWVPDELSTSTDGSRSALPARVDRAAAVFNLGRVGLLMAAIYEGDPGLLRRATEDRLHQPDRLARCPAAAAAIDAALSCGALAAWLSGSGPTVAVLVEPEAMPAVVAGLPGDGKVLELDIDEAGAIDE